MRTNPLFPKKQAASNGRLPARSNRGSGILLQGFPGWAGAFAGREIPHKPSGSRATASSRLADRGRSPPPPDEPDPTSETDYSPNRTEAGQSQGHAAPQKSLLRESLLDHHLGTGNGSG